MVGLPRRSIETKNKSKKGSPWQESKLSRRDKKQTQETNKQVSSVFEHLRQCY